MQYEEMTTDALLEKLPNNLHLARNDNAPDHDRWRIYNSATQKYAEPGAPTAREMMIIAFKRLDDQVKKWTGRE